MSVTKRLLLMLVLMVLLGSTAQAMSFNEAPMLRELVEKGALPPVEERLPHPDDVYIVEPIESIGKYGGTLRAATIRPMAGGDAAMVMSHFPTYVKPTPDLTEIVPHAAKALVPSEDMSTWTVHLRRGIKWSDGHPYTADDILFWYEDVLLNKDLTPVIGPQWRYDGKVMEVVKIDDYTVEYRFAGPKPYFPNQMIHAAWDIYPKHYLKQFHINYQDYDKLMEMTREAGYDEWYELFGERNSRDAGIPMQPDLPTLNSYKLESISSDRMVFVRNPYYWKVDTEGNQLPYIDRVDVAIVSDREVLNGMTLSGSLDFAAFQTDIRDYPMLRRYQEEGNFVVHLWKSGMNDCIYMFNMTHEDPVLRQIFQDVRFRRAMSLGINREEINDIIYFGQAQPAQYTLLNVSKYHKPEYEQAYAEYDPERANQLLDEMGLDQRDAEGYRLRPDGKRLTFTIEYFDNETPKGPNIELVSQHWAELGIDVRSRSISGELQGQRAPANMMDATVWHGDKATDILFPTQAQFITPQSPGWERTKWPLWGLWFETNGEQGEEPPELVKQIRAWWEQIMVEPDEAKRAELADNILRAQAENLWVIGTVAYAPYPVVVNKDLRNVASTGFWVWDSQWSSSHDPEQYYFDR